MTSDPQRKPIPLPDDFPVEWASEEEARQTWHRDTHHRPDPIPPLEADYWDRSSQAWEESSKMLGLERLYKGGGRCFNGYLYGHQVPLIEGEEKEAAKERNKSAEEKSHDDLPRRWDEEWLPEILGHLAFWDDFDLDGADLTNLDAHLVETWARIARLWAVHFAIVMPAYGAMRKLAEYYEELFEDYDEQADPFAAQRLFQAMPNLTTEMGHALWDISRQALADPELSALLREPSCSLDALRQDHGEFAAALDRYLDEHGRRPPTWTLSHPTWREDPTPVFKNLREYLRPDARDPRAEMATLAAERDETIAETRAKLAHFPQPARDRFEHLLQLAQTGMILSEDHGVYIDFGATARVRYVLLACGRRLVSADAIDDAEDVLFLHYDEIRAALAAQSLPDHRTLIAERRAAFERFSAVTPPDQIGVEPPPKEEKEDDKKEEPPDEPGVLRGTPCAPGIVRGPVRVLRSMTDTDRVQPGEIMVAVCTNPSWTPLFGTIAALVTQTGGKLSHGAVVAREYRIPAVLGVKDVFNQLKDGQRVEVDGTAGTIRLLEE